MSKQIKAHFDRAVALLENMAAVRADIKEWRGQARADGLDPGTLMKLAREYLLDAEQRRKAAERAEIEALYRETIGLPLFDFAEGRAAE